MGPSKKNTAFIKRGLTYNEKIVVEKTLAEAKEMWKSLYSKNKWVPQKSEKNTKF